MAKRLTESNPLSEKVERAMAALEEIGITFEVMGNLICVSHRDPTDGYAQDRVVLLDADNNEPMNSLPADVEYKLIIWE